MFRTGGIIPSSEILLNSTSNLELSSALHVSKLLNRNTTRATTHREDPFKAKFNEYLNQRLNALTRSKICWLNRIIMIKLTKLSVIKNNLVK